MIVKFLYQMDAKNKRVITGLVENDSYFSFTSETEYEMVLEDEYVLKEGERKISNFGKQYYGVFTLDEVKYINVNDFMLKVKLDMTSNPCFAATLSKDMLMSILENTDYFNSDYDIEYVDSGLTLMSDKGFKDYFDGWFRHVDDDTYVMFLNMKKPLYIGKEDNQYVITDDFKKAFRVSKKECRNLLIANGFIDTTMRKKDVAFSHYNFFESSNAYAFGGENSFKISYNDNVLQICRDFIPTNDFRLVNDKDRAQVLRDICYQFKKGDSGHKAILKVNNSYVHKIDELKYDLVTDASMASVLDTHEIDILKIAFRLYMDASYESLNPNSYYLYEDNNVYSLSSEKKDQRAIIISKKAYDKFVEAKNNKSNVLCVVKSLKGYLIYEEISPLSFKISYSKTAYKSKLIDKNIAVALKLIFNTNFNIYEFNQILDYKESHNINIIDKTISMIDSYHLFMEDVKKTSIRLNPNVDILTLKTESDKGALEYLTRFYLKNAYDTYYLSKLILNKENINNVLLVGQTSGADLCGLNNALEELDKSINLTVLETVKWGFNPKTYISNRISIDGVYRLPLSSIPEEVINKFDLIIVSRHYKDSDLSLRSLLRLMKESDKEILIAHLGMSLKYMLSDDFYASIKLSRRQFAIKGLENVNLLSSIIDNDVEYVTLLRIGNQKAIDLFKKA